MKNSVLLTLVLALGALGAACTQTETESGNATTAANRGAMNHNGGATTHSDSAMNHNAMSNSSNSSGGGHDMSQMHAAKSDPDAASAPYDLQFIDTMTHHHEGAIQMAEMILKKSQNDELKKFAQKIIDDQRKEIAQMKDWRGKWFAGKAPAKNMEMPGMQDSMKMMQPDHMKMMDAMTGKDFDVHFLEMMIPHHEGAVAMAKNALQKAERQEIKTLAQNVVKAQEAEIKQMNEWKEK